MGTILSVRRTDTTCKTISNLRNPCLINEANKDSFKEQA